MLPLALRVLAVSHLCLQLALATCSGCIGGSSGPCKTANNICYPMSNNVCPSETTQCAGSTTSTTTQCKPCATNSWGVCQAASGACYEKVDGGPPNYGRRCASGLTDCTTASYVAPSPSSRATTRSSGSSSSSSSSGKSKSDSKSNTTIGIVVSIVGCLVVIGGYLWYRGQPKPPPPKSETTTRSAVIPASAPQNISPTGRYASHNPVAPAYVSNSGIKPTFMQAHNPQLVPTNPTMHGPPMVYNSAHLVANPGALRMSYNSAQPSLSSYATNPHSVMTANAYSTNTSLSRVPSYASTPGFNSFQMPANGPNYPPMAPPYHQPSMQRY